MKGMRKIHTFKLNEILPHIWNGAPIHNWKGIRFRVNCKRLMLFKASQTCVTCGIAGNVFILEKGEKDNSKSTNVDANINLYHKPERGGLILMTMDHIMPRAKGGSNDPSNLQVMCEPCNTKKADTWP